MLIAKGNCWDECEKQINVSGYTGTTWEVYFRQDVDYPAHFFTDLTEAREFAQSITAETMAELFVDDAEGMSVNVEEDEWEDGEFIEIGFCTVYEYEWKNGKWEICA